MVLRADLAPHQVNPRAQSSLRTHRVAAADCVSRKRFFGVVGPWNYDIMGLKLPSYHWSLLTQPNTLRPQSFWLLINVDYPPGLQNRNSRHTLPRPQPCWPQQLAAAHEPRRCMNFPHPMNQWMIDDRHFTHHFKPYFCTHIVLFRSWFYRSCLQF